MQAIEIAKKLIKEMGYDNGCVFKYTEEQLTSLALAVDRMNETEKIHWTDEDIQQIVAGEESERIQKFGKIDGFYELDCILSAIFGDDYV